MNFFQHGEAKRRLLERGIVIAWGEFRSAIGTLVESYNETSEGKKHPAMIEPESSPEYLILSSARGLHEDDMHSILLMLRIELDKGQYSVIATKETWLTLSGAKIRSNTGVLRFTFTLDGDPETEKTWLMSVEFGEQSAAKAAESLLVKVLS